MRKLVVGMILLALTACGDEPSKNDAIDSKTTVSATANTSEREKLNAENTAQSTTTPTKKQKSDIEALSADGYKMQSYDLDHPLQPLDTSQFSGSFQRFLKSITTMPVLYNEQTLRITIDRPIVYYDGYKNDVSWTFCGARWTDKNAFGKYNWQKFEVMNETQGQGFAFVGTKKDCDVLGGKFENEQAHDKFLADHTWICVAGSCRPRKEGEKAVGE